MLLARAEIRKKFGSISFWGSQVSQSIPVPCFALLKILARIGWSEIDSKPLYLGIKTIVVFCICLPQSIETQGRTSFTQETTRLGRRTARWTLRFFQSCSADIFPARWCSWLMFSHVMQICEATLPFQALGYLCTYIYIHTCEPQIGSTWQFLPLHFSIFSDTVCVHTSLFEDRPNKCDGDISGMFCMMTIWTFGVYCYPPCLDKPIHPNIILYPVISPLLYIHNIYLYVCHILLWMFAKSCTSWIISHGYPGLLFQSQDLWKASLMEEISYRNYIILDPHDIYKKNNS